MAEQGTATAAPETSSGTSGGGSAPSAAPQSPEQSASQSSESQASEPQSAPRSTVAAAIRAKAGAQGAGQANADAQTQPDGQPATGEPDKGPDTKAAPDGADELDKWLESKGVKLGDVRQNPEVQRLLDMHRNLEGTYTKDRQALKELQEKEKTWLAQQQAQPVEEVSPVDRLKETYANAIAAQCSLYGCANEAQFAQQYPAAYQQLKSAYQEQWLEAVREEVEWKNGKVKREQEKATRDAQMAEHLRNANASMRKLVLDGKAKDPELETNLMMSGVAPFVTAVSKALKVPNSWIMGNPEWFPFLAEASHAIMAQRNIDKTRETWKQEYEADLAKAASVQSPSPIDQTPPDTKVVLARRTQRHKTANDF
jgi:hypothetical protein